MKVGDTVDRETASRLPEGSQVQRQDGPNTPYAVLTKRKGLWSGGWSGSGGLGTADWLIIRVGDAKLEDCVRTQEQTP